MPLGRILGLYRGKKTLDSKENVFLNNFLKSK